MKSPVTHSGREWFRARLKRHIHELLRLALPIMISRAGIMTMALVDTAMVGHFSSTELAYQSLGNAPVSTILVVSIGLMMGTLVTVSNAFGAERWKDCGLSWRRSLFYGLVIGVVGTALCYPGEFWLILLGQTPDLAKGGGAVIRIIGFGMPAFMAYLACTYFLEGIGRPIAGMIAMFFANIVNIAVNWVLVFGHLGFDAMGATGSAWATTLVRIFLAIVMLIYVWNMRDHVVFGIRDKITGAWADWRRQRHIGYAASVSMGLEVSAFTALNIFAGWLGVLALGAFSITFSMFAIVFMMASGIGGATSVRVGIADGRRDYPDMALAGWTGLGINTLLMVPFSLIFFFIPDVLTEFYTSDPALIAMATPLFILAGWLLFVDGAQVVMGSALRGRGETWVPALLYGVSYYLIMIPLGWALAFPAGRDVIGLFEATIWASIVSALLLAGRFHLLALRDIRNAAQLNQPQ